jgi:hypothetical protein
MTITVEDLPGIKDAAERARAAGELTIKHQAAADRFRERRDAAAVLALREGLVRQVDILGPMDVTRARLKRIIRRYEEREAAGEKVLTYKEPVAVLERYAPRVIEQDALAARAREIRNKAAKVLIDAEHRPADVSRLIGVTTARMAQMGLMVASA